MKQFLYSTTFSFLLLSGICHEGREQAAPVTHLSFVENAIPGSQVTIPVTVTGFNNIGSIALTLDYDFTSIQFVSATLHSQLTAAGNFATGDNDLGNGTHRLIMGWYGNGTTLTDNSTIISIVFNYLSGSTNLQWYDNGPSCAYTDFEGTFLNDSPSASFFINGRVCGTVGSGIINGINSVCSGSSDVLYTVSPVPGASTYSWSVPTGSVITAGHNTNAITVDYTATAVSGDVSVTGVNDCMSGPSSVLPVTVLPPPLAFAGNDTTVLPGSSIILKGRSMNAGLFDYHWYPENLIFSCTDQNPVTLNLTASTIFKMVVASPLTLCRDSDLILVTVDISTGSGWEDLTMDDTELNPDNFFIYPNPIKDRFIIKAKTDFPEALKVSLFSGNGALIINRERLEKNNAGEYIFDVCEVPPGMYYLVISSMSKKVMRKIIVL